jgi:hypothetical protein
LRRPRSGLRYCWMRTWLTAVKQFPAM